MYGMIWKEVGFDSEELRTLPQFGKRQKKVGVGSEELILVRGVRRMG